MAINDATFVVTCSPPPTQALSVDYLTVDELAVGFKDYIAASGTLVFNVGEASKKIIIPLRSSITDLALKNFKLVLSNPKLCALGQATQECQISGPPAYAAIPIPGFRACIIGDSIPYANHGYNPLVPSNANPSLPTVQRNSYFSTGMTGYFTCLNALMGQVFQLEHGIQPNTNPGANSTAAFHGYNFAIYSSQTNQGNLPDFDPIPGEAVVTHNIGPILNAQNHINGWDIGFYLWGTNNLSAGVAWQAVLNDIMAQNYGFAKQGKWMVVSGLFPRTGDLLAGGTNPDGSPNPGYDLDEQRLIMQGIQNINAGLDAWKATKPANIVIVNSYANLVGPQASLLGTPSDPAGQLSATTVTTTTVNGVTVKHTPSTPGNYRPEAPKSRFMYDGLHPSHPAGHVHAKDIQAALLAAPGFTLPAPNTLPPLTLGPNLMKNGATALAQAASPASPRAPRVVGQPLVLGRAIGLGAPLTDATHPTPGVADAPTNDTHANHGLGYTYGPVPDYFFIYRASNNDGESYSNFNAYTFSQFVGGLPALQPFMVDSQWADGCLKTQLISEVIDGVTTPGLQLTFQAPAGLTHNEAFIVRYIVGEGLNGPWNNYGYEGSATQAQFSTPPYSPGDKVAASCVVKFDGVNGGAMSSNLETWRFMNNFICYNPNNDNTSSAVISGIGMCESYYPFDNIAVIHQHPEAKTYYERACAVVAPTPAAGESLVYLQLNWQFAFDCSQDAASATIKIFKPNIHKITAPSSL